MKVVIFFFCLVFIEVTHADSALCYNSKEECHSTNYQSYVDCVRRRQKRSLDCESSCGSNNCINTCNNCDCNSCSYNNCQSSCNNCCSSCCNNYVPCYTNHCCHKTCHAQCSSSSCRSNCRKNCFENVREKTEDKIIIDRERETNIVSNITNLNRHNITTIIHLNNVINNTNVVDIPIGINNTNTQNITLINEQNSEAGSIEEKCCTVISPRQCVSDPKPHCFHYRSKQCGPFCTATIVHKEQQQVCQSYYPGAPPKCSQQVIYIPQPQPRCSYQSVWPYVSCGVQRQEACQGCYSHYTDPQSNNYLTCPPQCYDDGFGLGSIYRKGPVYRPWYSHVPCYNCLGNQNPYGGIAYEGYGGSVNDPYLSPAMGGYSGIGEPFSQGNNNDKVPVMSRFNPVPFIVEPGQVNPLPQEDLDNRPPREVEIEVNYEPSSKAQAEVKIKKEDTEIIPIMESDKNDNIIDTDEAK